MSASPKPDIVESFLEHKSRFSEPSVRIWTIPNPLIMAIWPFVKEHGASLTDFAFNADAKSVGESFLQIKLRALSCIIKIFPDRVQINANNVDWSSAPTLVPLFDKVLETVGKLTDQQISEHEIILAIHVTNGDIDVPAQIRSLLNIEKLGQADSYGISLTHEGGSVLVEKSLRHEKASFVRVMCKLQGQASFAEIATKLYEEEVRVLGLIGISGVV